MVKEFFEIGMDKKAETEVWKLISLIFAVLILLFVSIWIAKSGVIEKIKLLIPSFSSNEENGLKEKELINNTIEEQKASLEIGLKIAEKNEDVIIKTYTKEKIMHFFRNVWRKIFNIFGKNKKIEKRIATKEEILRSLSTTSLNSSTQDELTILNIAISKLGKDTIRTENCKGEECKKYVCAHFVSDVLKEFYEKRGENFKGSDYTISLEKIIEKRGWEKIYDYEKGGNIAEKFNRKTIKEIITPGRIVYLASSSTKSGFHVGIAVGYDEVGDKILFIDDAGSKYPILVSKDNINKLRKVYALL